MVLPGKGQRHKGGQHCRGQFIEWERVIQEPLQVDVRREILFR